jgi:hypothetical protein
MSINRSGLNLDWFESWRTNADHEAEFEQHRAHGVRGDWEDWYCPKCGLHTIVDPEEPTQKPSVSTAKRLWG